MSETAKKPEAGKPEEKESTLPVRPAIKNMRTLMDLQMPAIQQIAPKMIDPKRFVRIALSVFSRNEALQRCDPMSFIAALMTGAQLGLEVDGTLGEAAIIPYGGYAAFQTMYRGLLKLCRNSGEIKDIDADVVKKGDFFEHEKGTHPKLIHRYAKGKRGETTHVWAMFRLKNEGVKIVVIEAEEVRIHRDRYSKGWHKGEDFIAEYMAQNKNSTREKAFAVLAKSQKLSGWHTAEDQMFCKTALIRGSKMVPMSAEAARQIYKEERMEQGLSIPIEIPGQEDKPIGEAGKVIDAEFEMAATNGEGKTATEALKDKLKSKKAAPPTEEKKEPEKSETPAPAEEPKPILTASGLVRSVTSFKDPVRGVEAKKHLVMLDSMLGYTDLDGFFASAAETARKKGQTVYIEYEETDQYGPVICSLTVSAE